MQSLALSLVAMAVWLAAGQFNEILIPAEVFSAVHFIRVGLGISNALRAEAQNWGMTSSHHIVNKSLEE